MTTRFEIGDIMYFPTESTGGTWRYGRVIDTVDGYPHYIYDAFKREATCRFDGYTFVKRCEDALSTDPSWWKCDDTYIDPCDDVVCGAECFGHDLYSTACSNGECVQDTLLEANSSTCGYVPPDTDDEPTIFDIIMDNKELCAVVIVGGLIVMKAIK